MEIVEIKNHIVCDMEGCRNEADYYIKNSQSVSNYYSLKLCKDCAKKLNKLLTKTLKNKEKNQENEK